MKVVRSKAISFMEIKSKSDSSNYSTRLHSHNELSIGFIHQGSTSLNVENFNFKLSSGDIIIIPPQQIHLCIPVDNKAFNFHMIYINSSWFERTFVIDPVLLKARRYKIDQNKKEKLLKYLINWNVIKDPFVVEGLAIEILSDLLVKDINEIITKTKDNYKISEKDKESKIKDIYNLFKTNPVNNYHLDDLSELAGISKFSLIRSFRKIYDLTPHQFLVNARINLARSMLRKDRSVAEVAVECGFSDQSHFVKSFKLYYGMTPIEYKNSSKL